MMIMRVVVLAVKMMMVMMMMMLATDDDGDGDDGGGGGDGDDDDADDWINVLWMHWNRNVILSISSSLVRTKCVFLHFGPTASCHNNFWCS